MALPPSAPLDLHLPERKTLARAPTPAEPGDLPGLLARHHRSVVDAQVGAVQVSTLLTLNDVKIGDHGYLARARRQAERRAAAAAKYARRHPWRWPLL
jgi:hypothetical protein